MPDLASWLLQQITEDENAVDAQSDGGSTLTPLPILAYRERVLAECRAHRRIVELHNRIKAAYPGTTIEDDPCCGVCSAGGEYPGDGYPCETLRLLALPYAGREGYDEAWRP